MRLNPFWRRAAILAAGALASSAALAGDFGELLNGPGSGHVNLHPSRDVWIGVTGVRTSHCLGEERHSIRRDRFGRLA